MKRLRNGVLAIAALLATSMAGLWSWRPGLDAYAAHAYAAPAPEAGALTATWLGVTALLLSDGSSSVLIDPYFTRTHGLLHMLRTLHGPAIHFWNLPTRTSGASRPA